MQRLSLTPDQIESLLACGDYRGFVLKVMEIREKLPPKLTYAQIGRALGVRSRSYPRDILVGKKRLLPRHLPALASVLGLPGDLRRLFELLVEKDEPECRISGNDEAKILKAITNVKERIGEKGELSLRFEKAFQVADIPKIYAALGTVEKGALIREIGQRSGISGGRLEAALQQMVAMGLTARKGTRYLPISNHVNTSDLKQSEVFKKYFQKVTEDVLKDSRVNMNSDEKLFFSSALSVKESRMAELKSELRSLLLKFVDHSEEPTGDKVVSLLCALH